jgi:hypothetical protein
MTPPERPPWTRWLLRLALLVVVLLLLGAVVREVLWP